MKAKDLAKILGISPASVSLVINNKPGVSESTRNKVLNAIKEYGCEELLPENAEGQKTILFLVYRKKGVKTEASPYFSQIFSDIIEGVEHQAKASGYKLMISYADCKSIYSEVEKIRGEQIDGLLLLSTEMVEEQMKLFVDMQIPTVMIDNYMKSVGIDCVTINNEQGVDAAISYLVSMGHKDIAYLHIEDNANNFVERYYGFVRSINENHLLISKKNFIGFSTIGGDAAYTELKTRLAYLKKMPTAFFADNDIIAMWTMRILREMGYAIPEDISIVGFDNIAISEFLDPPLTTIHTPKFEIGRVAVNTLSNKMIGDIDASQKIEIKTTLIKRKSVKNI